MEKENSDDVAFEFTCPECNITFYGQVDDSDFHDSEEGSARLCPACQEEKDNKKNQ